jgi:glycosyltransferase involved in cell wall biosynthesis
MTKFRTLQIGNVDAIGSRFNGQDLHSALNVAGFDSHHLVWKKFGNDERTMELDYPFKSELNNAIKDIESALSIQSVLHPAPLWIARNEHFRAADLVHYHLLHTGWFSLLGLPHLTKNRPSVLTLHDPWNLTGHCSYPRACDRWMTGCGSCPDLDVIQTMKSDNTHRMWQIKKDVFAKSNLEIIVASNWMLQKVQASPIFSHFKHHLIPFGIDLEKFRPGEAEAARKKLGIYQGHIVICLRATVSPFKGLPYVYEALEKLTTTQPITILTVEDKQLFKDYLGKHQLIDLGWVTSTDLLAEAYRAADIFLMPSTAEAFGVMAIEAMASGKPTIVFEGTSLPEVTFAPKGALAVPMGDSGALAHALTQLIENKEMRNAIGRDARQLAEEHYSWKTHVARIIELYEHVIAEKTAKAAR